MIVDGPLIYDIHKGFYLCECQLAQLIKSLSLDKGPVFESRLYKKETYWCFDSMVKRNHYWADAIDFKSYHIHNFLYFFLQKGVYIWDAVDASIDNVI